MNLKALQARLRDFAAARDWQSFHSPKNLAMALMVEAAELLELFQWLTTEQSNTLTRDAVDKERVGDEIADVLLYLLQLADHTGVDVEQAVEQKLRKNAEKYPAKHPLRPAPGPKGHLLVDWENVQPRGAELRALVPEGTDVWLFHGPQQKVDKSSHLLSFGIGGVTLVPRTGTGRNALDFQLSYYIGYISARQPHEKFVVVSNDTGYDPMLAHARELGFDATRCEFRRPPAPAVAPPAKPKAASAAHKPKTVARLPASCATARSVAPVVEPSAAQIAWRAIVYLRQLPEERRPAQTVDWQPLVETLIHESVGDKAALAKHACQLVWGRRLGLAQAPDGLNFAGTSAKVSPTPAVQKVAVACTVVRAPANAKKRVIALKTTPAKQATKKSPATAVTQKAKRPAAKAVSAPQKVTAAPTAAQITQRVLASLKKMPDNKPTRKSALLKMIKSQVGATIGGDAIALQVLSLLQTRRDVVFTEPGDGVSYPRMAAVIPGQGL